MQPHLPNTNVNEQKIMSMDNILVKTASTKSLVSDMLRGVYSAHNRKRCS
jgi:hypothetical protein